jgi:hypothetical protein
VQAGEERPVLEGLRDERVDVLLEREVDPDATMGPSRRWRPLAACINQPAAGMMSQPSGEGRDALVSS